MLINKAVRRFRAVLQSLRECSHLYPSRGGDMPDGRRPNMTAPETVELERYFYHSFPRRGRGENVEVQKGLSILEIIRDFGLLLTPEITDWEYPHADGTPPRKMTMIQRRACFTELSPRDLPRHANEFGHFALEFEVDTLKSLHALPVFYIPRGNTSPLGQTLVVQLIDAMCMIERMARTKNLIDSSALAPRVNFEFGFSLTGLKIFDIDVEEFRRSIEAITYAATPPEMLSLALEGVMNLFYFADADDTRESSALKYYRQREWRIAGNIGYMGEGLMGLPSKALTDRLLAVDANFFEREFPRRGAVPTNPSLNNRSFGNRLVDWVYVYQGIDERHIIGAARRVIVPREAMEAAQGILSKHSSPPPVIAMEELV
jgi:hypothetical protein